MQHTVQNLDGPVKEYFGVEPGVTRQLKYPEGSCLLTSLDYQQVTDSEGEGDPDQMMTSLE